jgi:hypothetical protein
MTSNKSLDKLRDDVAWRSLCLARCNDNFDEAAAKAEAFLAELGIEDTDVNCTLGRVLWSSKLQLLLQVHVWGEGNMDLYEKLTEGEHARYISIGTTEDYRYEREFLVSNNDKFMVMGLIRMNMTLPRQVAEDLRAAGVVEVKHETFRSTTEHVICQI